MAGFATRLALNEGGYFNSENRASLINRVRALVEAGELPKSVLQAIDAPASGGGVPTEIRRRPDFEQAFQHVHNKWKPVPMPSAVERYKLGTPVSFGRARWSSDGTSIFSVADGHALAQTPPKEPTHFERIRAERLARAQLETPLVRGLRLMPEYTPGRALFWGSVLALWGTAGVFLTAKRSLGIDSSADASDRLAAIMTPYADWFHQRFAPMREAYALPGNRGVEPPEIAQRLKGLFR